MDFIVVRQIPSVPRCLRSLQAKKEMRLEWWMLLQLWIVVLSV
jgi:hypothetical protein